MSEEKKAWAGPGDSATTAEGTTPVQASSSDSGTKRRPRNQDVLPGILGKQLRAAYGELLNAPLPDAINDLVKKLDSAQPCGKPPAPKDGDAEDAQ